MSKRSKAKGSHYEREFVAKIDELGLPAMRVPLSGAMEGYKDDVVIADVVRAECKYRKEGAGFKRLHDWMPAEGCLSFAGLLVWHLPDYIEALRKMIDGEDVEEPLITFAKSKQNKVLLDWMGEADILALRKAQHPWLVCTRGMGIRGKT